MKNLKTILISAAILTLIILCLIFRYQRDKIIKEKATIEAKKEYLQKELNAILAVLKNSKDEVVKVSGENTILQQDLKKATKKANESNNQYQLLIEQAKKASSDSSYNYFQTKYEPGVNELLIYKFSPSQVNIMHVNDLELKSCINNKKGLQNQLNACIKLNNGREREIRLLNKEIKDHEAAFETQGKLLDNSFCENEVLIKELRRNKTWKNIFKYALIGAGWHCLVSSF